MNIFKKNKSTQEVKDYNPIPNYVFYPSENWQIVDTSEVDIKVFLKNEGVLEQDIQVFRKNVNPLTKELYNHLQNGPHDFTYSVIHNRTKTNEERVSIVLYSQCRKILIKYNGVSLATADDRLLLATNEEFKDICSVISICDLDFNQSKDPSLDSYFSFVLNYLLNHKKDIVEDTRFILDKRSVKAKAKKDIGKKFIRGNHYYLRDKKSKITKEFELKQIIWTINEDVVNSLIMKQISGPNNAMFTLNNYDCQKFHIKFEPGLQVFSMELNWIFKK